MEVQTVRCWVGEGAADRRAGTDSCWQLQGFWMYGKVLKSKVVAAEVPWRLCQLQTAAMALLVILFGYTVL